MGLLVLAPCAHGATASVEGELVRVAAAPGELNAIWVSASSADARVTVSDLGAPLRAGPGCSAVAGGTECAAPAGGAPLARVAVDAGDLDDAVTVVGELPALVSGGEGDDRLTGGDGADTVLPGAGADFVDGGGGADAADVRDGVSDSVWCGRGRDAVVTEELDALSLGCEGVDYGPAGRVGPVTRVSGGGRFARIPGQTWARVDRRVLADVLYLVRRYHVRITEGYGTVGHEPFGEHPLGLAVDIEPGPGGSWAGVARLARWAEPRQNHPRRPFRWVGWNGDFNHGHPSVCKPARGCAPHLHLSWRHSRARPRSFARTVWAFAVR